MSATPEPPVELYGSPLISIPDGYIVQHWVLILDCVNLGDLEDVDHRSDLIIRCSPGVPLWQALGLLGGATIDVDLQMRRLFTERLDEEDDE